MFVICCRRYNISLYKNSKTTNFKNATGFRFKIPFYIRDYRINYRSYSDCFKGR